MKTTARGFIAGLSLFILALSSVATTALAQAPAKPLKQRLIGHWQLVSVVAKDRAPYGPSPLGSMFFDAGGHFAVIVISAGNARSLSYFGSYTVDDAAQSMTLHIDGNAGGSGISAAGREIKRLISFKGDDLVVTSERPTGEAGNLAVTWKPAN